MSYFQRARPGCKIESIYTTSREKKIDCFIVDDFCSHCNIWFEAMACFYHFCHCEEVRPSLAEQDNQRGTNKKELYQFRRSFIREKSFTVIEMSECEWLRLYKTSEDVKKHIRENFS